MEETYQTKEGFIKSMILFVVLLGICFAPFFAFSQIPTRIIVNSGFESPATGCSPASYNFIEQANVLGWKTEDAGSAPLVSCGTNTGTNRPYLIEIWNSGFSGRNAHSGTQFAEINGNNATFLYQEICLLANEAVPFSVWHLRRANSGTGEQMVAELKVNSTTTISTAATHTATGVWTNYTGTLTNNGTSGLRRYGFRAVSGGSLGNLIDDIRITLRPLADIKAFSFNSVYETGTNSLEIYVNGTLLGPATITITKAGTATYLTDYTIGNPTRGSSAINAAGDIVLTLPAGDYNPNLSTGSTAGLITLPFTVINEGIYESNETVQYTVTGSSNGGNGNAALNLGTSINGQSAACVATVATSQFTIIDAISLPVKLISFTAEKEVGFNSINWTVAEEENIRKYIVEYSVNGNDFAPVGEVIYNPSNNFNYTYTHVTGDHLNISYRLKSEDLEGNISELGSPITLMKNINTTFSIYPNPNKGEFTATFFSPIETETELVVCDFVGKKVYSIFTHAYKGENSVPLKIDQPLETGIYYIMYTHGGMTRRVRINIVK
jgi:hypothetical protein